jgi:(2Fe-2S) ferredoxin
MSKHHHKHIRSLAGHFLGWGDDLAPHKYIKLATIEGDRLVKVAKGLRSQIQDWQPGICLMLLIQDTGNQKIQVKQLLAPPAIDSVCTLPVNLAASKLIDPAPAALAKIQVCQGSSCRKHDSESICQSMQAYLSQNDLTNRVEIETVKCLHHCKAAPHAIVVSPATAILPGKTHYHKVQPKQVATMLSKHFPLPAPSIPIEADLISKIGNYFHQQSISTFNSVS